MIINEFCPDSGLPRLPDGRLILRMAAFGTTAGGEADVWFMRCAVWAEQLGNATGVHALAGALALLQEGFTTSFVMDEQDAGAPVFLPHAAWHTIPIMDVQTREPVSGWEQMVIQEPPSPEEDPVWQARALRDHFNWRAHRALSEVAEFEAEQLEVHDVAARQVYRQECAALRATIRTWFVDTQLARDRLASAPLAAEIRIQMGKAEDQLELMQRQVGQLIGEFVQQESLCAQQFNQQMRQDGLIWAHEKLLAMQAVLEAYGEQRLVTLANKLVSSGWKQSSVLCRHCSSDIEQPGKGRCLPCERIGRGEAAP